MNDTKRKITTFILIIIVATIAIVGVTYSFFNALVTNSGTVSGRTAKFNITLNMTTTKRGTLIPADDSNIPTFLNNADICQDARGYDACSVYKITLANTGTISRTVNGYFVTTNSAESTNFKYALYTKSTTYSIASDINTVSMSTSTKNYFKISNNNMTFTLNANQTAEYYLVIWLSNLNSNQLSDQNKSYAGKIYFESTAGNISASFS